MRHVLTALVQNQPGVLAHLGFPYERLREIRDDVIYMGSPLAHQTGFLYAVLFSIFHGTKCVLQDVWEPVEASRLIAGGGVIAPEELTRLDEVDIRQSRVFEGGAGA